MAAQTAVRLVSGCIPGAAAILLSVLSEGRIGAGDGIVLIALGIWTGAVRTAAVFAAGLMFACVWAAGYLLAEKRLRRVIPFVPCLGAGFSITAILF